MTVLAGGPVQSVDWLAIAPPTIAALTGLAALVADLFLPPARKRALGWIAVGGLGLAMLSLLPLLDGDRDTFCLTTGPAACGYVVDQFTLVIQLLALGGALLTALLSTAAVPEEELPAGEFWFLLLSSAAGAALLPAARDLATLVIALEVVSLPAFALVGLRRGDRLSSEAALKFFLTSVTATAVTLLGVSFVYATTGSVHLATVAERLPEADPRLGTLATTGVVLTLVGFAFKTAAVPFHFWVPETYVGAPLPVAGYLSVVGKTSGLAGLILLVVLAFPGHDHVWAPGLAVLAALTMTTGNVAALRQRPERRHSAVRLLAWSSVGQAGYLLVPLAAAGAGEPAEAIGATIAYALMYAVVNLGAFAVAAHQSAAGAARRISDYRGLYGRHPLAALALGFFLLCLAGLPPGVIGLFGKVVVFQAAVDADLGWLAVVMAVNVVIALYYYLQWTALLFRPGSERQVVRSDSQSESELGSGLSGPHPAPAPGPGSGAGAGAPPRSGRFATGVAVSVALTVLLGIALSGAPQLVLRFATGTLL
ncbi:NADH-quinone oxidoreductase subunit N [Streptomyces oceani]|uniref:NADH-quinone oxidoreductase subunit N n=1 Tax=Streptomyces oceani TaxID=1075402 RepID=A0A1E7KHK4_9ACTN|nr:NADH-quinone oxidoreductase subunit N [Streptomyces oceani]OEV03430.1 NADH-quinone oxidoreductase subunit N [Streptomyces oceani]